MWIATLATTAFWYETTPARSWAWHRFSTTTWRYSPHLMEHDDVDEHLRHQGPKIGGSFAIVACANIRARLIALKDFEYEDPGFGYPTWKLEVANRLKDQMIGQILA